VGIDIWVVQSELNGSAGSRLDARRIIQVWAREVFPLWENLRNERIIITDEYPILWQIYWRLGEGKMNGLCEQRAVSCGIGY
jgi:hypothetical protein